MKSFLSFLLLCCLPLSALLAQDATPLIRQYLLENKESLHLNTQEATDGWMISDQYLTRHNQVTQVYVQQTIRGLKLHNAISSVAVKNGAVAVFNSRFVPEAPDMANAAPGAHKVSARQAILQAAADVNVKISNLRAREEQANIANISTFIAEGDVKGSIEVFAVYQLTAEEVRLAWNVEMKAKSDIWSIRIDAITGAVLDKSNFTVYCNFAHDAYTHPHTEGFTYPAPHTSAAPETIGGGAAAYNVIAFPDESPLHASRTLVTDPADAVASPFGWHDTDGKPGAEYTITRGNNVLASEDRDDNDTPGYSPDGGAALLFDFPFDPLQSPLVWEDAAITNMFYANNIMHDMSYRFGFDEGAGNYQENNYAKGGEEADAVQADAQDGSGTNNANFSAPRDGQNGRMQMYIFTGGGTGDSIQINSPANIAGLYNAPVSGFGPEVAVPITAEVVLVDDGTAPTSDACQAITNGAQLIGKIALIDRGTCSFTVKVMAAQNAGAVAVIVCNNNAGAPIGMSGTSTTITIPSVMISMADCQKLKTEMANGPVVATFRPSPKHPDRDSDMDNGIIAHEYGHGISIRLTGGPANSGCLNNAEQMGEGWSDFYALVSTIHPKDTRNTPRPMGNYSLGLPINGPGIRNEVYSTDLNVCDYTYGDLPATQGEVHNIGELWTAMLWDMTWDLIDQYGFEPNFYASTGGNNIAQQLVTDGFKLQVCNPGFVNGRDAILQADKLNYNGANQCLIWKSFARRGLGYSAKQGSSDSFTDGVEAFDLPPLCLVATEAPKAAFTVDRTSDCVGLASFQFTDQSQNIAQYYLWNFGDGGTSDLPNPSHTYTATGKYTVSLKVTNNIGADSIVQTDYITVTSIAPPTVAPSTPICAGKSATLTATLNTAGNTAEWTDANGNLVFTGAIFNTPPLPATTTYTVREAENVPSQKVGPVDNKGGGGGNHNTAGVRKVNFTALKAFTIKTVLVYAQGAGNRPISLFDAAGNILKTVTVNIPNGESRIALNLAVPGPGDYALGAGPNTNLYRNNNGIQYPFTLANLVTITGSNAGQDGFYYYFYDWEVQETPCRSTSVSVTVKVTPGPIGNFAFTTSAGNTATFKDSSTGTISSWQWNFGDGDTSSLQNPVHTYALPGTYTVTLTVSNGTCTTTVTKTVTFTSGISGVQTELFNVELSPNPASDLVQMTLSGSPGSQQVQISIHSVDGRLVQRGTYDATPGRAINLNVSELANGLYLVKVEAAAGMVVRKLRIEN